MGVPDTAMPRPGRRAGTSTELVATSIPRPRRSTVLAPSRVARHRLPSVPRGRPDDRRGSGRRARSLRRISAFLAAAVAAFTVAVLFGGFFVVEELTSARPSPGQLDRLEAQLDDAAFEGLEIPRDDPRTLESVTVAFKEKETGLVLVEGRAAELDVATLQGPEWSPAIELFLDDRADLAFSVQPDRVRAILTMVSLVLPILVVVVFALAATTIGRALRPVARLRADLAALGAPSRDPRVIAPDTDDELTRLIDDVSHMLERLDAGDRAHHQFVADASHELRSPVAAIRTVAEVALTGPSDPDTRGRALQLVADEDARMDDLVEDLLELARAAALPPTHEPVDLGEIVVAEARRARRIPVDCSGVEAARVEGDRQQLTRLIRNLLDNAARHGATLVTVTLHHRHQHITLLVDDDGDGIPADDRARVFDRFVRLDDGRSRDRGGTGLGLAVVAAVAQHHSGHVDAQRSPTGGARFHVRLPAPPPQVIPLRAIGDPVAAPVHHEPADRKPVRHSRHRSAGRRSAPVSGSAAAAPVVSPTRIRPSGANRGRAQASLASSLRRRGALVASAVAVSTAAVLVAGLVLLEQFAVSTGPSPEQLEQARTEVDQALFEGREIELEDPGVLDVIEVVLQDGTGAVMAEAKGSELSLASRQSPEWAQAIERLETGEWALWVDAVAVPDQLLLLMVVVAAPAVMVLVFVLTLLLTGRALRPVVQLRAGIAAIDITSLNARVPLPVADDEFGPLIAEVNLVLERLAAEDAEHRRFVADASHALRRPVRAIRTITHAALTGPPDTTTRGHALQLVTEENTRLEQVVQNLLELARAAAPPTTHATVDLDDIVLAEAGRARRLPVDCSGVGAARLRGERHQLTRMVGNLLDNAARHAATHVAVTLHHHDDSITLLVDDDGRGIPAADRTRIFDRFVRLDEGRSSDEGGAGLGLAVVAAVADRHGGHVDAQQSPTGGARLHVRLFAPMDA